MPPKKKLVKKDAKKVAPPKVVEKNREEETQSEEESRSEDESRTEDESQTEEAAQPEGENRGNDAPKKSDKKKTIRKKAINKSARAGITFPVGRIKRLLRKGNWAERIGEGGAIYLAAVLEYLTAELVELAGIISQENRRQRIVPRHILMAIKRDDEFNMLLKDVTISYGGVMSYINPVLLPKPTKARATASANDVDDENYHSESD